MDETKTIDLSNRFFNLIVIIVAVAALFVILQMLYQFQALPQNAPREISVSGEGKAYIKPDIAMVSFGAHTEAIKSQDAVNQNNTIMDKVIKAVKNLGVDEKDIQTTSYSLNPLYDYIEKGRNFKGYSLDQQLEVKIRNFDNINGILDAATVNGVNTVGSLQFMVDDMEKIRAEAREKAIMQAKEKAGLLIGQAGLRIEKLVNISEGYSANPQPMYGVGSAEKDLAMPSIAPQIQTGQMEINSTVTLTYRVR